MILKNILLLGFILFFSFCDESQGETQGGSLMSLQEGIQKITSHAKLSVVQVLTDRDTKDNNRKAINPNDPLENYRHYFDPGQGPRFGGGASGFLVDPPGTVVTNAHVVDGVSRFRVRLDNGDEYEAELLGADKEADIAVLKISADDIQTIQWGDSSLVTPGTIILALGSPFGLQNSVSFGIVSAVGRKMHPDSTKTYIQIDAAINSGNSGGPLVDFQGQVVGVNTFIFGSFLGSNTGVNFAVPGNLAKEVVANILYGTSEKTSWLGIIPDKSSSGKNGILVQYVIPDSPAYAGGVHKGDLLVEINEQKIESVFQLRALIENLKSEENINLRLAKKQDLIKVQLQKRPKKITLPVAASGVDKADEKNQFTDDENKLLGQSLLGRNCPCTCGRTLANCFGCSEAKSEYSEARRLVRSGMASKKVREHLDAPITARVWFDYTDQKSIELLNILEKVENRLFGLIRIIRRYIPSHEDNLDNMRQTINAVEIAREQGKYDHAHAWMISGDGKSWKKRIKKMPKSLGLDKDNYWKGITDSRYESQIQKDITAGLAQFGTTSSPTLQINTAHFSGEITLEAILAEFEIHLLEASL